MGGLEVVELLLLSCNSRGPFIVDTGGPGALGLKWGTSSLNVGACLRRESAEVRRGIAEVGAREERLTNLTVVDFKLVPNVRLIDVTVRLFIGDVFGVASPLSRVSVRVGETVDFSSQGLLGGGAALVKEVKRDFGTVLPGWVDVAFKGVIDVEAFASGQVRIVSECYKRVIGVLLAVISVLLTVVGGLPVGLRRGSQIGSVGVDRLGEEARAEGGFGIDGQLDSLLEVVEDDIATRPPVLNDVGQVVKGGGVGSVAGKGVSDTTDQAWVITGHKSL